MSLNAGHGKVLYKNQPVIDGDLLGTEFSATRHGNGKDWWILLQKRNSNCYYRVLFSDTGIQLLPDLACIGAPVQQGYIGTTCFSPDGNKYVYLAGDTGLNIFDFDRCSGELSNPLNFPLPVIVEKGWLGMGVVISPNNRFLYVSLTRHLYQFDLEATDVLGSIDTVGIFDGTNAPFAALFSTAQNGPDGKIYISCGNADTVYHVINHPDLKGAACDFRQHSLSLPSPSGGVPSFPNYRLGRKVDSECDTIWNNVDEEAISRREKVLKVFPNPATDVVTVDYGFTDWSKSPLTPEGGMTMELVNELGQVVHHQTLPQYSGFQRVNVSSYPAGFYTTYIKRNNQVIATSKFAKQ